MRSYRELPLRLFEFGTVYRYERSGVVHGLARVSRLHPGRRAHLLHQGADGRRAAVAARRSCSTCCATSASTTSTSSCRPSPRASPSAPTRSGTRPRRRCARPRSRWTSACVLDARRRRVLRPEDRGAGPRRDRPHVAGLDDPGRLPAAAALRARVRRRRQRAPPPIMIHRALFGSIERFFAILRRALRGRVPGLAGAGAGRGPARRRRATTRTRARRRPPAGRGLPRRRWSTPHDDTLGARVRDGRSSRRCRTCSSSATTTSRTARSGVNRRGSRRARAGRRRSTTFAGAACGRRRSSVARARSRVSARAPLGRAGASAYVIGRRATADTVDRRECVFCAARPRAARRGDAGRSHASELVVRAARTPTRTRPGT